MLEKKLEISFEYFASTESFSIYKDSLVLEDGQEIARTRHTKAFTPGMVDELAKYLEDSNHPLVSYCNIIWTPEIIKAQEECNKENQI